MRSEKTWIKRTATTWFRAQELQESSPSDIMSLELLYRLKVSGQSLDDSNVSTTALSEHCEDPNVDEARCPFEAGALDLQFKTMASYVLPHSAASIQIVLANECQKRTTWKSCRQCYNVRSVR